MKDPAPRLVELFREMAGHTLPECTHTCRAPLSCCSPEYCGMAQEVAQEEWGVDITHLKTNHPTLPFMGEQGCVVPPHFRPLCTLHTCQISGIGFKPGDEPWNKKYWKIRNEIDRLENQRLLKKDEENEPPI